MSMDAAARLAYRAGLSILPVAADGSKRPDVPTWRTFQTARPTPEQMRGFDFPTRSGIGLIAGVASGYRECWDFDDAPTFEAYVAAATACGLGDVVDRIRQGYEDVTPGGGRRWIVQYPAEINWQDCTLARRRGRDGEPAIKTLIELPTFAIVAPSNGATHPTGKPYLRRHGGFDTIAAYTVDEREALMTLARSFDQLPRRVPAAVPHSASEIGGTRPGDDYARRTSWAAILEPAGWTVVYERDQVTYWRRPGKTFGVSATTNYAGSDLFYPFTGSTAFDSDTSYTKFGAYALLVHGGDFTRAAIALQEQGYGSSGGGLSTCTTQGHTTSHLPDRAVPVSPEAAFELRVQGELDRQRAQREARRRLNWDAAVRLPAPDIATLRERLARPRTLMQWRIENWQPVGTRVVVAAQFKAGKTTLIGGYLRCLVDGDPWLGRDRVTPITGTAVLLDTEMNETQLDDWLRAQRIRHDDRVIPIPLRGAAASFNILDDQIRAQWVARLRDLAAAHLSLDCLRPVLDASGLDEHREAGRFLVAFDALLLEAGIPEALIVQHMGHLGERSRGDSRLRDWPDVEWRLVRKDDDPASARFLAAYGRDVDQAECQLHFESLTRRLTIAGGSRHETATAEVLTHVLSALEAVPGPLSLRGIQQAMADADLPRDQVRAAIKYGVRLGRIVTSPGARGAILHRVCGTVRECAPHGASECAAAYIEPHTRTLTRPEPVNERSRTLDLDTADDLPACLDELTEPDLSDPIGAHDDDGARRV